MNSFTFGLLTGVVASVLLATLLKQSSPAPSSMEEKLLGPNASEKSAPPSSVPTSAPGSLADALAQKDQASA